MDEDLQFVVEIIPNAPTRNQHAWYDTEEGNKFLDKRLTVYARSDIVTAYMRHKVTISTQEKPLWAKLKIPPRMFRNWLRSVDKPTDNQIYYSMLRSTYHDPAHANQRKLDWEYVPDDQVAPDTYPRPWRFWIRDFEIIPNVSSQIWNEKYEERKRELRLQETSVVHAQRAHDHTAMPRTNLAPNMVQTILQAMHPEASPTTTPSTTSVPNVQQNPNQPG